MDKKCLVILDVSQKQSFIFSSNKLIDNITNSAIISHVTSVAFLENISGDKLFREKHLIYSGGGHTLLEFDGTSDQATAFIKKVSKIVLEQYPKLEFFATTYVTEGPPCGKDIEKLLIKLEKKQFLRRPYFHQGSFGVENIESTTLEPQLLTINGNKYGTSIPKEEKNIDDELFPKGFQKANKFENLGGNKGNNNFISVVHIDGNAMGKRVTQIREQFADDLWDSYKEKMKEFCDMTDRHYKEAYRAMCNKVANMIRDGKLQELSLQKEKDKYPYFPIRRIITAGDDICFVTEGRIGLECARIFIESLSKKINPADNKTYSACAGVAIVHQKFPFYKAYDLAEKLCKNAKKFLVQTGAKDAESENSAIDWHIEYGEVDDTIEELREKYIAADKSHLELRPYILVGSKEFLNKYKERQYQNFRKLMLAFQDKKIAYAKGKIRNYMDYIQEGETASDLYLKQNIMEELRLVGYEGIYKDIETSRIGSGIGLDRCSFIQSDDGKKHSLFFDAIEMIDVFLALED